MVTTSTENLFMRVFKKAICGCFLFSKTHRFFNFSSVREGSTTKLSLVQFVPLRVQLVFSKLLKVCFTTFSSFLISWSRK